MLVAVALAEWLLGDTSSRGVERRGARDRSRSCANLSRSATVRKCGRRPLCYGKGTALRFGGDGVEMTVEMPAPTVPGLTISCQGRDYTLAADDGPVMIGRQFPAQVIVDDPRISRNHLRLQADEQGWRAYDHSSNGVYLNGERQQEFSVADQLTVHLGHPDGIPVSFELTTGADVSLQTRDTTTAPHHDDGETADVTLAVGDNDIGVVRAGAAVSARRRELGISQRSLAADGIVNAGALIAFEKGRSWPRSSTRAKLEEVLRWPPGTIVRIRRGEAVGAPAPPGTATAGAGFSGMSAGGEDPTEAVTTNIVGAPLMAQAVELALSGISARIEQLDNLPADRHHAAVSELLGELRNLENVASAAASMATRAPSVLIALSEVRRAYRALMLRAAKDPDATAGQKLFAARDRSELTATEAANAAGVTVEEIHAAEADQPLSAPVESAVQALYRWLTGT
ncbi:FHA domain-containing protein [Mycolicibacterium moriokaense]|nr:FHA domain-containing protein [Mycolicibacterium moriokaense]